MSHSDALLLADDDEMPPPAGADSAGAGADRRLMVLLSVCVQRGGAITAGAAERDDTMYGR